MNEYLRIESPGIGEYREKGSKFIGYSFPFFSESSLKIELDRLRKEHYQSRHIAFAYRLNPNSQIERANDDGEPAHTAGTPILHALQSSDLYESIVYVVRYFGGTKLGKPGLIRAYKAAADESILNASSIWHKETILCHLRFPYSEMNAVQTWLNRNNLKPNEMNMEKDVRMLIQLGLTEKDTLLRPLLEDGRITFVEDPYSH